MIELARAIYLSAFWHAMTKSTRHMPVRRRQWVIQNRDNLPGWIFT